jgi:hypothetical protein
MQPPSNEKPASKYDLCDDMAEIFAMLYDEGGPDDLRELLRANKCTREALEDAALGLTDAGMHKAARIVTDSAKISPSEDYGDICPYKEGSKDAEWWHQALSRQRASRRWWREEQRRRKRAGTWHVRRKP